VVKKLLIALVAGALLAPVGLALSSTGGKGLVRGGSTKCTKYAKRAHAAGGTYRKCVVVARTTITKTKTVYYPVTVTRTLNHATTSTRNTTVTRTYSSTTTGYVTQTQLHTVTAPDSTTTTFVTTSEPFPGVTQTVTETSTVTTTTTTTATIGPSGPSGFAGSAGD
jgi:hypothetical protein